MLPQRAGAGRRGRTQTDTCTRRTCCASWRNMWNFCRASKGESELGVLGSFLRHTRHARRAHRARVFAWSDARAGRRRLQRDTARSLPAAVQQRACRREVGCEHGLLRPKVGVEAARRSDGGRGDCRDIGRECKGITLQWRRAGARPGRTPIRKVARAGSIVARRRAAQRYRAIELWRPWVCREEKTKRPAGAPPSSCQGQVQFDRSRRCAPHSLRTGGRGGAPNGGVARSRARTLGVVGPRTAVPIAKVGMTGRHRRRPRHGVCGVVGEVDRGVAVARATVGAGQVGGRKPGRERR